VEGGEPKPGQRARLSFDASRNGTNRDKGKARHDNDSEDDTTQGGSGDSDKSSSGDDNTENDRNDGGQNSTDQDDEGTVDIRKRMVRVRRGSSQDDDGALYAAIMIGLDTIYVDIETSEDGKGKEIVFPEDLCGPVFIMITNDQGKTDDEHTIAGPVALRFPCNSRGQPVDPIQ
jgi:hypothetical protein